MFKIVMGIWKETIDGRRGVALSKSKSIKRELAGLIVPNAESMAFYWVGHVCKHFNVDIIDRD